MKNFQLVLYALLMIFVSQKLFCQDSIDGDKKEHGRNFHISTGAFTAINYDQKIIASRNVDHSLNAGIQFGILTDFGLYDFNFDNVFNVNLHIIGLLGVDRSFVELGVGPDLRFGTGMPELRVQVLSRIFAGYRYKFERGLFRVGLGLPELVYLGGGIRF